MKPGDLGAGPGNRLRLLRRVAGQTALEAQQLAQVAGQQQGSQVPPCEDDNRVLSEALPDQLRGLERGRVPVHQGVAAGVRRQPRRRQPRRDRDQGGSDQDHPRVTHGPGGQRPEPLSCSHRPKTTERWLIRCEPALDGRNRAAGPVAGRTPRPRKLRARSPRPAPPAAGSARCSPAHIAAAQLLSKRPVSLGSQHWSPGGGLGPEAHSLLSGGWHGMGGPIAEHPPWSAGNGGSHPMTGPAGQEP